MLLACDVNRLLVSGIEVAHNTSAGVAGEHALQAAVAFFGAVENHDHAPRVSATDAHAGPIMKGTQEIRPRTAAEAMSGVNGGRRDRAKYR